MSKTYMIDTGYHSFKRRVLDLEKKSLFVGILDHDSELALIANVLEFGSEDGVIPERPVHRDTYQKLRHELKSKYAQVINLVSEGKISPKQAMARIGSWYAGKLRWAIIKYNEVPNAESTIKQKGFDDPLINTGDYVNSIDWEFK